MKKVKKEINLVRLRKKKFKQFNCWKPTPDEFNDLVYKVYNEIYQTHLEWQQIILQHKIDLVIVVSDYSKYYVGRNMTFGQFKGQPLSERTVIEIYRDDFLIANLFQKELIKEHLYYVIEHEIQHYFGMKHEDLKSDKDLGDFGYPL